LPDDLSRKHQFTWTPDFDSKSTVMREIMFAIASQGNAHLNRGIDLLQADGSRDLVMTALRPQIVRSKLFYEELEKCNFDVCFPSVMHSDRWQLVVYQYRLLKSKLLNK
jgi:hypothetical protein